MDNYTEHRHDHNYPHIFTNDQLYQIFTELEKLENQEDEVVESF